MRVALRHAFGEAWSIARSGPGRTLLSVGLISLALYVPGLLVLLTENASRLAARVDNPPSLVITVAPTSDPHPLAGAVAGLPGVVRVRIVGSGAARARFEQTFPDLKTALSDLKDLEFPATLEVILSRHSSKDAASRLAAKCRAMPGVEQVQEEQVFEARFREFLSIMRRFALGLGTILCLAAVLSVATAVRLALDQHRDEVEIMRLMGATEWKIRAPFWLHGALEGATGGLLAILLLLATYQAASQMLAGASHPVLAIFWVKFFQPLELVVFPLAGSLAGLLGAALSIREGTI
jgi:cell division transport system permease protein